MKRNGFTLIELLVVVAIIGILAAVGVVAYNGYTASAKVNSVKTMRSTVIKYVNAEMMKCSLGENKAFSNHLNQSLELCEVIIETLTSLQRKQYLTGIYITAMTLVI
jgi:prepilin-type N-terminal cleavage/methylation domain-containing protein